MSPTGQKFIPRCIIIHRTESGHTGDEVLLAEKEQGCGYHYFIRKDGGIDQLYLDNDLIWHALAWSRHGIGIAVFGDFDPKEASVNREPTAEQIGSLIALVQDLWRKYGMLPLYGHTELPRATMFPDKVCPGSALDVHSIQTRALAKFCSVIQPTIV